MRKCKVVQTYLCKTEKEAVKLMDEIFSFGNGVNTYEQGQYYVVEMLAWVV